MRKIFLLFILFVLPVFAQECINCEEVASLTPVRLVLVPDEVNYFVKIILYNISKPSNPVPMPNAVIIIHRYNATDRFFEKVYTDQNGIAIYNFSSYKDECYSYQIMFCSCNDSKVRECCLKINNIDITKPDTPFTISGIKNAPNLVYTPTEVIYDYHSFPATSNYAYCKPKTTTTPVTPAFCLPLAIIFALLGGSLVLTGRNPLRGFEIGGARVGKHIRYDARGRYAGYSLMSIASTAGAISSAVKDRKDISSKEGFGEAARTRKEELIKQKKEIIKGTREKVDTSVKAWGVVYKGGYKEAIKKGGVLGEVYKVPVIGKAAFVTKETGARIAKAAAALPLTIASGVVNQFYRIQTGAGSQGKVQLTPSIEATEEGQIISKLSNLFDKLGFKIGEDILQSYSNLLNRLNSYSSIEVAKAQIEVQKRAKELQDLQKEIKVKGEKDGTKYEAGIKSEAEISQKVKFKGKNVKFRGQADDGSYIYEEDGVLKTISPKDKEYGRFGEALAKAKATVGAVVITLSDGKESYIVSSGEKKGDIVVSDMNNNQYKITIKDGKIEVVDKNKPTQPLQDNIAKKIKDVYGVYNDIISQKPDFAIGERNDIFIQIETAQAKYINAVKTLQGYEWIVRNDLLKDISKEVNANVNNTFHRDPQAMVKFDSTVIDQIIQISPDIVDEKTQQAYKEAAKGYADVLSLDYAAKKLRISKEELQDSMKKASYEGDVKGYIQMLTSKLQGAYEPSARETFMHPNLSYSNLSSYNSEIKKAEDNYKEQISKIRDELRGASKQLSSLQSTASLVSGYMDVSNAAAIDAALSILPPNIMEKEREAFRKAAEKYAQVSSPDHLADRLGISSKKLQEDMKATGYENNISGYLSAVREGNLQNSKLQLDKDQMNALLDELTKANEDYTKCISEIKNKLSQLSSIQNNIQYIEERGKDPYNIAAALEKSSIVSDSVLQSLPKEQSDAVKVLANYVKFKKNLILLDNSIYFVNGMPRKPEEIEARHNKVKQDIDEMVAMVATGVNAARTQDEKTRMENLNTIIRYGSDRAEMKNEEFKQQSEE